jgi:hypothetical protein
LGCNEVYYTVPTCKSDKRPARATCEAAMKLRCCRDVPAMKLQRSGGEGRMCSDGSAMRFDAAAVERRCGCDAQRCGGVVCGGEAAVLG